VQHHRRNEAQSSVYFGSTAFAESSHLLAGLFFEIR